MDPKTMPNRRCKCEDKSHEKCPVVHGTDHCTVHLGSIISQSIEKVTFYSYFDYLVNQCREAIFSSSREISIILTSVPKKKRIPSTVLIHYCAWYSFFRNGRY